MTAIIDPNPARCYKHVLCAGGAQPVTRCMLAVQSVSDAAKSALLIVFMSCGGSVVGTLVAVCARMEMPANSRLAQRKHTVVTPE